jgi:2-oxo-3-hexenedioate decarboxylase
VIAAEAFGVLDTGRQIAPFSSRLPAFSLADAYRVTAAVRRLRETRGERPIGRKIGFTNRTTWPDYAPMWGYVYDRTVHDLAGHAGTNEYRVTPGILVPPVAGVLDLLPQFHRGKALTYAAGARSS